MIIFHRLSKKGQISNFINTHPMEAHLFRADGRTEGGTDRQTDRQTQLRVVFRNFTKAPATESVWTSNWFLQSIQNDSVQNCINKQVNKITELTLGAHVLTDPPQHV